MGTLTLEIDDRIISHARAYEQATGRSINDMIIRRLTNLRIPRPQPEEPPKGLIHPGTHIIILPDPNHKGRTIRLRITPCMLSDRESDHNRMIAILMAGAYLYVAQLDQIPVRDIRRFAELLYPVSRNLVKHLTHVKGFRIIECANAKDKAIRLIEPEFHDTFHRTLLTVKDIGDDQNISDSSDTSVNE